MSESFLKRENEKTNGKESLLRSVQHYKRKETAANRGITSAVRAAGKQGRKIWQNLRKKENLLKREAWGL